MTRARRRPHRRARLPATRPPRVTERSAGQARPRSPPAPRRSAPRARALAQQQQLRSESATWSGAAAGERHTAGRRGRRQFLRQHGRAARDTLAQQLRLACGCLSRSDATTMRQRSARCGSQAGERTSCLASRCASSSDAMGAAAPNEPTRMPEERAYWRTPQSPGVPPATSSHQQCPLARPSLTLPLVGLVCPSFLPPCYVARACALRRCCVRHRRQRAAAPPPSCARHVTASVPRYGACTRRGSVRARLRQQAGVRSLAVVTRLAN